jgi:hypothetical protein
VAQLAKPFNLLMPFRGHKLTVQVQSQVSGELPAMMKGATEPKMLPTIRLFTRRLDKQTPAAYVDVTCTQPQAMLEGFLRSGSLIGKAVTFRASGKGPTRRDTIHIKRIGG